MLRALRTFNFQSSVRSGRYLCGLSPGPHDLVTGTWDLQPSSETVLHQARENLFLGGAGKEERPTRLSHSQEPGKVPDPLHSPQMRRLRASEKLSW